MMMMMMLLMTLMMLSLGANPLLQQVWGVVRGSRWLWHCRMGRTLIIIIILTPRIRDSSYYSVTKKTG